MIDRSILLLYKRDPGSAIFLVNIWPFRIRTSCSPPRWGNPHNFSCLNIDGTSAGAVIFILVYAHRVFLDLDAMIRDVAEIWVAGGWLSRLEDCKVRLG